MRLKKSSQNKLLIILTVLVLFLSFGSAVFAQTQANVDLTNAQMGLGGADLKSVIKGIVNVFFSFLGVIAVLILLYGGFVWMTAAGDESKVEKAKKTIIAAVIGLVIIFSAFAIVSFVFRALNVATGIPGTEPCSNIGEVTSCSTSDNCSGTRYCQASGYWGACLKTDPTCPGDSFYSNQFSYILGFSLAGSGWNKNLGRNFSGTVAVPQSANLFIYGYAHDRENIISEMSLWGSLSSSSEAKLAQFNNLNSVKQLIGSKEYNVVSKASTTWNTSGYAVGDIITLKIKVSTGAFASKNIKAKVYASHCFNGIKDADEKNVDCGGSCSACDGDSCFVATNSTCSGDNCLSGICGDNCKCASLPIIDYISPAKDVNGDSNPYRSETLDDDLPNGAPGNIITIWGRSFGSATGTVIFKDKQSGQQFTSSIAPCKSNNWNNNQLTVLIPQSITNTLNVVDESGVTSTTLNYEVFIETANHLLSEAGKGFQVNKIERPGICNMDPDSGVYPTTTTINGIKFPISGTQNVLWKIKNGSLFETITSTLAKSWTAASVIDTALENKNGVSSVRIYNGSQYSNYFKFLLSSGGLNAPCGLDPRACDQDVTTCNTGLACDKASCTCQKSNTSCSVGEKQVCDNGGCAGDQTCRPDGVFGNCIQRDSKCIPKTDKVSIAGQTFYSWAFLTNPGGNGQSCGYDYWDVCDIKGCGSGLACDTTGTSSPYNINKTPCTCWTKVCEPATVSSTCKAIGKCEARSVCNSQGTAWGECVKVDYTCNPFPEIEPARQAFYSWSFMAFKNDPFNAPEVIEDCNRTITCRDGSKLPSPTPWYNPVVGATDEGWSTTTHPNLVGNVLNPKACVNAIISARFSLPMKLSSFAGNIKIMQMDEASSTWSEIPITVSNYQLLSGGTQLNLNHANFSPATRYKVVLRQGIASDAGVKIKKYNDVIGSDKRDCNVGGINDAAYCWNFVTRAATDPDLLCKEGCPTCSPDPTQMFYYGEEKANNADLDSADNVCLMLNPFNYDWFWDKKSYNNLERIDVTNNDLLKYVAESSTFAYGNDGKNDPYQTSTARGETISDPAKSTKILATLVKTGKAGICYVENDFTNPIVMEDQSCNKGTTQSPSPWKGSTDACINGVISLRFSRNMVNSTLVSGSEKTGTQVIDKQTVNFKYYESHPNIVIQKCNSNTVTSTDINACTDVGVDWKTILFKYSHQTISIADMMASSSENVNELPEGLSILPSSNLDKNQWYRVIIIGGQNGVRGAKIINSNETKDGVLRGTNNSPLTDMNGDGEDDYYWIFKTASDKCPINSVTVLPFSKFMKFVSETQTYNAWPQAANCNILNPLTYNWNWKALIDLNDDRSDNTDPGTGNDIVKVCSVNNTTCSSYDNPTSFQVNATGESEGLVNLKARALDTAKTGEDWTRDKWGYSVLQVGYGGFYIRKHSPDSTKCLNPEITALFSLDAKSESINLGSNFSLYKCQGGNCNTEKELAELSPLGLGTANANPFLSNLLRTEPKVYLEASSTYRVIAKSGESGLKAWNGNSLTGLNYRTSGTGNGEQCDKDAYPWKEFSGLCTDKCLISTSTAFADLCSYQKGRFAECKYTTSTAAYCDNTCHALGNTNTGSCGNGKLEAEEECDDGNFKDGDGCSSRCLLGGSSDKWGSVCGNGKREYGELCDDGNRRGGDGCSSACLTDSRKMGTATSSPVCGNSRVEFGELCDDGNKISGDGCSNKCLLEGSSNGAVCGNKVMENGQNDSYAWDFKVESNAQECLGPNLENNPCPNGIWRVNFPDSNNMEGTKYNQFSIKVWQKSSVDAGSCEVIAQGFWKTIFRKVKVAVLRLFGQTASAADYWCPFIEEQAFGASDLTEMKKGNYVRTFDNPGVSNAGQIIAYTDEVGNYIINFARTDAASWPANDYKMTLSYTRDLINQEINTDIKFAISRNACPINDVMVNVWPKGEERKDDTFFCAGNDCGSKTADPYDDDMSANWTYSKNGYDLKEGVGYLGGNQHLYRAWALTNRYGRPMVVQANFNWDMEHIPFNTKTTSSDFSLTTYNGDKWITSGDVGGRDLLNVTASDVNTLASTTVMIRTFLCNNPWPTPAKFPYIDSRVNCANPANCVNTNFELFYCRDSGDKETTDDDLPALTPDNPIVVPGASGSEIVKEFIFPRADKTTSSDAVGLRVMNNSGNALAVSKIYLSPAEWYFNQFDKARQGKPKGLVVDGYQAVEEGRTAYVSAADLNENLGNAFNNIYLLSYNDKADQGTRNIYSQILSNLTFNTGEAENGGLLDSAGSCTNNPAYKCFTDKDCKGFGFCDSPKSRITRDTKRLADISDINLGLEKYKAVKRCSNDHSKTCLSSSVCADNGTCGNYYPTLTSGTYVANNSLSSWLSWESTLAAALGMILPVDPRNELSGCTGSYSSTTCWSEIKKEMACPSDSSFNYFYHADKNPTSTIMGTAKILGTKCEYCVNSNGDDIWSNSDYTNSIFGPTNSVIRSFCIDKVKETCGNGISDIANGENCHNCPSDFKAACSNGAVCQNLGTNISPNWQCKAYDTDGDNFSDAIDNCKYVKNGWNWPGLCIANGNASQSYLCDQFDSDRDGVGNACDNCYQALGPNDKPDPSNKDSDGDGIGDACDNCLNKWNPGQEDDDGDKVGNTCDNSKDVKNGASGNNMTCPLSTPQSYCNQKDTDGDGVGDASDNCLNKKNPDQKDSDTDGLGDVCDNCPTKANPDQKDGDLDSYGDACDNCPTTFNPNQDSRACYNPNCGNGAQDRGEACDCGTDPNNIPSTCNYINNFNVNILDIEYNKSVRVCMNNCQLDQKFEGPKCGDGIKNGAESCDNGSQNGVVPAAGGYGQPAVEYCTTECQIASVASPRCGDGTIQSGEVCDTPNQDGCAPDCKSKCGNGIVEKAQGEICDDSNGNSGDGCSSTCRVVETGYNCFYRFVSGRLESVCQSICPPDRGVGRWTSEVLKYGNNNTSNNFGTIGSVYNSWLQVPKCKSFSGIFKADVNVSGSPGSLAVVFVSDISGSMDGKTNALSQAITSSSDELSKKFGANIALVHFHTNTIGDKELIGDMFSESCSGNYDSNGVWSNGKDTKYCCASSNGRGNYFCNSSDLLTGFSSLTSFISDRTSKIYGRYVNGGTPTASGLDRARAILNTSTADKKIIILMSDGMYDGINPLSTSTNIKAGGTKIYVAAFTTSSTLANMMSTWSSNNNSSCGSGYCYYSGNVTDLYENITSNIQSELDSYSVTIFNNNTYYYGISPYTYNQSKYSWTDGYSSKVSIPNTSNNTPSGVTLSAFTGFCAPSNGTGDYVGRSITVKTTNPISAGTSWKVNISNVTMEYCPLDPVGYSSDINNPTLGLSQSNSQVAGAYEENDNLYQRFIATIANSWKFLFSSIINLF